MAVAAVAATVVLPAGVASADPAGPTDYEARVVGVAPTDPAAAVPSGVGLTVEGHDSFLWLRLLPGMTAEVPGYDGEPYLRIDADGSVHRNRLSWSTWYNEDRFGDVERPDFVDPAASPDWELIDDDSSVAWHDHRIHLMDPVPPIGAEPGDVVLTSVVPVTVDGVDLEVRVETTLVAGPSARPMLGGLMIGVAVVAAFVVFGGRRIGAVTVMASTAGLVALVVGGVQYLSQPIDTGPDRLWVAVPLAGLLAGLIGVVLERSGRWFWATGSAVVTGAMVGWWFLGRWSVFTSALIPTALPGSVDRLSTAAVGVVAAAVVIGSIGVLVRPGPVPGSADERSEPVA
ncbi:MAG: hypothetical protein ACO35E_06205 [Ilumatobacteraceae bacterium]